MSTMLRFAGTVHPPHADCCAHEADLTTAEMDCLDLGHGSGGKVTPLLIEHRGDPVGVCDSSWLGSRGELRVAGRILDPETQKQVRTGNLHGLSLGISVLKRLGATTGAASAPPMRSVLELSLCAEPARAGCYISALDGVLLPKRGVRAAHACV